MQRSSKLPKGIKTLFEDQERLRENLKALRDNTEDQQLRVRYLDQLKKQEDRIDVARSGMENTNKEIASVRAKLGGLISNLSYEELISGFKEMPLGSSFRTFQVQSRARVLMGQRTGRQFQRLEGSIPGIPGSLYG